MKQWILDLICRWFGHKDFEEVYCERSAPRITWYFKRGWKQRIAKVRYDVIQQITCDRCGQTHRKVLRSELSRAELLKAGWFLERD